MIPQLANKQGSRLLCHDNNFHIYFTLFHFSNYLMKSVKNIREFRCMDGNFQLVALSLTFEKWWKTHKVKWTVVMSGYWLLPLENFDRTMWIECAYKNFFVILFVLLVAFEGDFSHQKRKCKGNLRVFTWKIKRSLWAVSDSRVMVFRSERVKSKISCSKLINSSFLMSKNLAGWK